MSSKSDVGVIDENSVFQRVVVKYRVPLGFIFGIILILVTLPQKLFFQGGLLKAAFGNGPTYLSIALGFPAVLLGEGIRTWSSGIIVKRKELTTAGPYSLTRNPLYLGSFIMALGVTVMSGSLLLLGLVAVLYPLVYDGLIRREEKFLHGVYGQAFLDYCERVPRFFPSFSNWSPSSGYDLERVLKKHKEWRAWLAVVAVTAYLIYCAAKGVEKP